MQQKNFTNHLIHETSPYLLQHAHNPVEWYPWSDGALQKAIEEDKPILVSIGYAACHWCHVMERESFEDEATAEIMNKYFVSIKIDREERPDLDHIYMDAVQAMTGGGGWPLNVFLTPQKKPFYGGTYFPPERAFNRMSWKETLLAVHEAYTNKKNEIEAQAENLTKYINDSNSFGLSKTEDAISFSKENLQTIADNILQTADTVWGGFGNAPKFPQTFIIQYLLRHYHFTKHEASLKQALLSLDKMIQGGIYDQLGGGFARYSTDTKWLAPHFEKMLYDNALLVNVLAEAYQLTHNETYAEIIKETLDFVNRELTSPEGGFYSALDADSEGAEGKYYTWSKAEIEDILNDDAEIFCKVYNISEKGNWSEGTPLEEHSNILWLPEPVKSWSEKLNLDEIFLKNKLNSCKTKLLEHRNERIKPLLDDKILLGWNSLMITACCKAYAATSEKLYLQMAQKNISFLENNLKQHDAWFHSWKETAKYPAFLDDHAYLIQAYIHLQEVTGEAEYLFKAEDLTKKVILSFSDEENIFFFFTDDAQSDIIIKKKEVYDGATPSGNSVMALNLFYLSIVFDKFEWRKRAEAMLRSLKEAIIRYPTSFGVWGLYMQQEVGGLNEIVVTGTSAFELIAEINKLFIPNKIIQSAMLPFEEFPLLRGKFENKTGDLIYLCRNYLCEEPVETVEKLRLLLKS